MRCLCLYTSAPLFRIGPGIINEHTLCQARLVSEARQCIDMLCYSSLAIQA
jgi:hypothetical protein